MRLTKNLLTLTAALLGWSPFAGALAVQYSLRPRTGVILQPTCEDGEGHKRTSDVEIKLSSTRLEPTSTVGLDIRATLCVLFTGVVEKSYTFRAFPIVDVLRISLNHSGLVRLAPDDLKTLEAQTGERLSADARVEHLQNDLRSVYSVSLLSVTGATVAQLDLSLSDDEAAKLPNYDYQTQLPIVAFTASYSGFSLTSNTRSITTIGLKRKPIAARAVPRACTLWEWFVSFFVGPNPNCK